MFSFECWVTNLKLEWDGSTLLLMEGTLHSINSILGTFERIRLDSISELFLEKLKKGHASHIMAIE